MTSVRSRVLRAMNPQLGLWMTNTELARRLGVPASQVSSVTCRLWKAGKLRRHGEGPYYYGHAHVWRLGSCSAGKTRAGMKLIFEVPQGFVGCACGARKPFDIFEYFKDYR